MDSHAIDSLMSSFGTFSEKEKLMKNISAREEVSARAPHKQEVKTEQTQSVFADVQSMETIFPAFSVFP